MKAIRDFPKPNSEGKVREFLGLVNFYHRFLQHCAAILQPLNDLLAGANQKNKTISWTEEATTAFCSIKEALANATLLVHPHPDAATSIMTDASDTSVGAVLQQCIDDPWCPMSYFSIKLKPAETRYSTFDRELLANYLSIKHFRHFVEGREFCIFTDHKPLTHEISSHSNHHSPRQIHHLDFISQFTGDIQHISGTENLVADALSRIELNAFQDKRSQVIDFEAIAKAQQGDSELTTLQSSQTSLKLEAVPVPIDLTRRSSVTLLQRYLARLCLYSSDALFLMLSMHSLTQAYVPHNGSSQLGHISIRMCASGSIMHTMTAFKGTMAHHHPTLHVRSTHC